MAGRRADLSGVFAPVVTPFRDDRPDLEALACNLRRLAETALTGYLALGSNGEYRSLTWDEQRSILDVFAAEKGGKVVMVGTGCDSTRETIERTLSAAQMGFDYASVLTPSYFASRMTGEVLESYYGRVADASPIPVLLYNAPGFAAGVEIPPATVVRLAAHPNISGMKDSARPGPGRYLSVLPRGSDFQILAGSASFFYPALHLGAVGGVLSLANSLPEACCRLYELFQSGRFDDARALHERLTRANAASSGRYGVAGVKAVMDLVGLRGGDPRHPLGPLGRDERERLAMVLRTEGFTE